MNIGVMAAAASDQRRGKCLCRSVSISVTVEGPKFDACHCGVCRRWGGGPAFSVDASKGVTFSGEEFIATYASSPWAERGFCKECGTHLFYRLKSSNYCKVSLGLLDEANAFTFGTQVFIDAKPACYAFANQTETLTESEVIAKFSASPT